MKRAVFLDRDGTIIRQVNDLRRMKDVRLLPGAARAIRAFNKMGFLVLMHTNQPVVARGWLSEEQLQMIHGVLCERLRKRGARVDAVYYCPHHPNADLKKYRMRCACRKPRAGMLRQGVKEFRVNTRRSFLVGDTTFDILAGKRAGLKTILVQTGEAGGDGRYNVKPDFTAKNLLEVATLIKKKSRRQRVSG